MSIVNNKFKNQYRIRTSRLQNWDYASAGYYYVTICTNNRSNYFGKIVETQNFASLRLSKIGQIAKEYWQGIPQYFPFVRLDEFIVMPNHIHGIINIVETQNFASLQKPCSYNEYGPQSKNLASIIRGYKAGLKKWATMNNVVFQWQSRYYDHVIRDERSLNQIREYIINNPSQWANDSENKR